MEIIIDNKLKEITGRVIILLESLEETPAAVARELDHKDPRKIYNIIHGKNYATLRIIVEILARYKNVNTDWILHGEGEMMERGIDGPA